MATAITAAHRVKELGSPILHADGGILFCTSCNVSLDHTGWAMVQRHLQSESHRNRKRAFNIALLENDHTQKKQQFHLLLSRPRAQKIVSWLQWNLWVLLQALTYHRKTLITQNVQNSGRLPSAHKLQQDYLMKVFATHCEEMKSQVNASESSAIICDESSDEQALQYHAAHLKYNSDFVSEELTH
ncbi:CGG triplet repeat-binding protein 1-like [Heterodontus francisci]|uniref:CGG triplet repeat-binding protein 1-like n=1 Tax=Heterodontus francisci TaxID=7792 RepID=UPI00355BBFF7